VFFERAGHNAVARIGRRRLPGIATSVILVTTPIEPQPIQQFGVDGDYVEFARGLRSAAFRRLCEIREVRNSLSPSATLGSATIVRPCFQAMPYDADGMAGNPGML